MRQENDWIKSEYLNQKTKPHRLFYFSLHFSLNIILFYLLTHDLSLPVRTLLSILLGINFAASGFFAHEFIHGYIITNQRLQTLLSIPCMYFTLISPTFWRFWHLMHHKHGTKDKNINGFQTINWVKNVKINQLIVKITPKEQGAFYFIYLLFWKSFAMTINQIFFLFRSNFKKRISATWVFSELLFLISIHIWVFYTFDLLTIIFIEIIPWLVQNFVASSFVVTNHHPRLIAKKLSLRNSVTATIGIKWIDSYFLNSGFHVEHHLYQNINPELYPIISNQLSLNGNLNYKKHSIFKCLNIIFFKN